jgi:ectoine hydroxylase-related dioxygenase (phytanoyl-CoA dioxygenase family)
MINDTDLASIHRPITELFAFNGASKLSDVQIGFFNEFGYLAGVPILDEEQIDALRTELVELMRPEMSEDPRFYEYHHNESADPDKVLFHALGAWRVSAAFHDLLFDPRFTVPASQLLGGPVRFWHDQIFVKPANDGAVVAWHQDYSYWTRTKPMAHLTCWIGLDDSNEANGCVHYVPGSHRWKLLPRTDLANDMEAVLEVLNDEQKSQFKPVPTVLKAGEASFHHPMMLHGSYENRSDQPRRAAVINVFRDGVVANSDDPLLEGVPAIRKGNKIDGQFFPILSSR